MKIAPSSSFTKALSGSGTIEGGPVLEDNFSLRQKGVSFVAHRYQVIYVPTLEGDRYMCSHITICGSVVKRNGELGVRDAQCGYSNPELSEDAPAWVKELAERVRPRQTPPVLGTESFTLTAD